jgi:hypothetical protein
MRRRTRPTRPSSSSPSCTRRYEAPHQADQAVQQLPELHQALRGAAPGRPGRPAAPRAASGAMRRRTRPTRPSSSSPSCTRRHEAPHQADQAVRASRGHGEYTHPCSYIPHSPLPQGGCILKGLQGGWSPLLFRVREDPGGEMQARGRARAPRGATTRGARGDRWGLGPFFHRRR